MHWEKQKLFISIKNPNYHIYLFKNGYILTPRHFQQSKYHCILFLLVIWISVGGLDNWHEEAAKSRGSNQQQGSSNGFLLVYLVGVLKHFHEEKTGPPCALIDEHEDDSRKLHYSGGSRTDAKFINGLDLRLAVWSSARTLRFTLMEATGPMGYSSWLIWGLCCCFMQDIPSMEAEALLMGLQLAENWTSTPLRWRDSMKIIQAMKNPSEYRTSGAVVTYDCRNLMTSFGRARIMHWGREANVDSHELARFCFIERAWEV